MCVSRLLFGLSLVRKFITFQNVFTNFLSIHSYFKESFKLINYFSSKIIMLKKYKKTI